MLNALKFVKGAVASKGFAPELTHFKIENGLIKGFNGKLALASPIALDLEVSPKAIPFIKAIAACKETTVMSITPTGRLAIKSGKFRAFIECIDEAYPELEPQGEKREVPSSFVHILKKLAPFMAEDASRPWARGILLRGQSAFVTNNIIIIQAWMEKSFPVEVNIPASAVKELIRIKEDPTHFSLSENTATFFFPNGRWLRTNLSSLEWPDVTPILSRECSPKALPDNFFEALEDISPFVDEIGRAIFHEGAVRTSIEKGIGASVELDGLPEEGVFNLKQMQKLETVVDKIDLEGYPAPCIFYGRMLRGAIIGIRS